MAISLSSPAFSEGAMIPKRHACDGNNLSPELAWSKSGLPVKSYAVVAEDPDAPSRTFIHWVIFNIPPEARGLPAGVAVRKEIPGIGRQGVNDAKTNGYFGPCPPPGKPHRYFFRIFALDEMLDLPSGCTAAELQREMQSHLLDSGSLMGTYHR
ncbi:MAG: YbhB/YbcL family Raf kinase inhibitor-like protein [Anaerolineales bacterium]|nr:YbhB/YbcL family Raf kinase inhibitor-like protein [Anaerolineales bacterium]